MSVPSVQIAKDRLHDLLSADRLKCTPDMAEKLSSDIYYTISKYKNQARQFWLLHAAKLLEQSFAAFLYIIICLIEISGIPRVCDVVF